jgi:hypothetical protein
MCDMYKWQRPSLEKMLHIDGESKGSVAKDTDNEAEEARRQDELIYGKPPVVK